MADLNGPRMEHPEIQPALKMQRYSFQIYSIKRRLEAAQKMDNNTKQIIKVFIESVF